jgi:hypothetical protein
VKAENSVDRQKFSAASCIIGGAFSWPIRRILGSHFVKNSGIE